MIRAGVLGSGQLARMMALAGLPLGFEFTFLDPAEMACARSLGRLIQAPFDDPAALRELARQCDVVTYDFENVPAQAAEWLAANTKVNPNPRALMVSQDRWDEKNQLRDLGIPTPDFYRIDSRADLLAAVSATGLPAVLKTRRFGYDGKGQAVLRQQEDLERAWQRLSGQDLILESFVSFAAECSIIAVRSVSGDIRYWPVVMNLHSQGMLELSVAPYFSAQLQTHAESLIRRVLEHFDYVGVLTLELFLLDSGELLANEMAPRVHNSGHWTIEGATTSQFENHLRAISDMPLGSTRAQGHSLMLNCIGQMPDQAAYLPVPGLHWHDYGKVARPGRKVGHLTLTAPTSAELLRAAGQLPLKLGGLSGKIQELLTGASTGQG